MKAVQKRISVGLVNMIKKIQKEEQRAENIKYGRKARKITFSMASQILVRNVK